MEQTPPAEAFELVSTEPGKYSVIFAPSVCYGNVVSGGIVQCAVHRAAVDFILNYGHRKAHSDVLHITSRFFRPTFPEPQNAQLSLRVVNESKALTTLQFDIYQSNSLCLSGFLSMTRLSVPDQASAPTDWKLCPSPVPCRLEDLESDRDSDWVGYLTPFSPKSYRNPQSYVKYHIPKTRVGRHTVDQWISPGWKDPSNPSGPVWTSEIIHFALDNCFPHLNDIMAPNVTLTLYDAVLQAGRQQAEARAKGQDDRVWGKGLRPQDGFPWILSTVALSTEVKKSLTKRGERWLFMRATAKSLKDGRMDIEITLMDATGNIVALSQHLVQVIPLGGKTERKKGPKAKV